MSGPRIKRPFAGAASDPSQRQITSFFAAQSWDEHLASEPPRQPILPPNVQSNLLSVGMRVRKSVPEGYKTTVPSAFKLWTDDTTLSPVLIASSVKGSSRELLPFCGINKIGGLDTQPVFGSDEDEDVPALDAIPELTMSQESTDSTLSSVSNENSRKRVYDEHGDGEPRQLWSPLKAWDGEVSPRSLAPVGWGNARAMAIPRSRAKRSPPRKQVDQENMAVDGDFEEAEFLVYGSDGEMDMTA